MKHKIQFKPSIINFEGKPQIEIIYDFFFLIDFKLLWLSIVLPWVQEVAANEIVFCRVRDVQI